MNPATGLTSPAFGLEGTRLRVGELSGEAPLRRISPSPCAEACPAGINVKAYVSLIAAQRFEDALEVVRAQCPLPGVCGRVCTHPCESACRRGELDAPVSIRNLKRFVSDLELQDPVYPDPVPPRHTTPVAIVGSGPAGLTAAWDLRRSGFPVTVFEADGAPGGMLRYGIARYRLPAEVLDYEIELIARSGVEIVTGTRLGSDIDLEGLLRKGYGAVLLAVGAQLGRRLGLAGERGRPEIEDALAFLRRASTGDRTPPGAAVHVIGGGSTAIEAARTAVRLGASHVEVLYRRSREEMPASEEEIVAAESEGVRFQYLVAPRAIHTGDGKLAVECLRNTLGEPDASGRRSPVPLPGSEFRVVTNRVLAAIGQQADLSFLPAPQMTQLRDNGRIVTDGATAMTRIKGVFAAGDVMTGPSTVVEAIGGGHRAARAIRRYLHGLPLADPPPRPRAPELELPGTPPVKDARRHPREAPLAAGREFEETELAFSTEDAVAEARRCLSCGPCGECRVCVPSCRHRHVLARAPLGSQPGPGTLIRVPGRFGVALDSARVHHGELVPARQAEPGAGRCEALRVELRPGRAEIHEGLCRACARCVEVCPFDAVVLHEGPEGSWTARIDEAECRGCALCAGVCPTGAARSLTHGPAWRQGRFDEVLAKGVLRGAEAPVVAITCEARAGELAGEVEATGGQVTLIALRCLGQFQAGHALELGRRGAQRILLVGCADSSCRYGTGNAEARAQLDQAARLLEMLGHSECMVVGDWDGRALDEVVREAFASPPRGVVRPLVGREAREVRHV